MTVTIDAKAPNAAPGGRDTQPAKGTAPGTANAEHPAPRLAGADALRAIAALAVIVVHTAHWPLQDQGADQAVWYGATLLARFCVPAFVLLSGLVIAYRYGERKLGGAFLLRRTRRSIVPWLAWVPVFCLAGLFYDNEIVPSWSGVSDWLSLGGGHLYYLILVPQLYVLMLLWPSRRRAAVMLAAALLAVQIALQAVRLYVPMPGNPLQQGVLNHGFEEFPFWIGYFAVGVAAGLVLASRRGRGLPAWPFALAVPVSAAALLWVGHSGMANPLFADGTGAFLRPLMVPFALALSGAVVFGAPPLLRRMPLLDRATATLSRHSLGIYAVHPLLITFYGRMLTSGLHTHLPNAIGPLVLLTVATAVSALLVTMLIVRTPLAPIVGEKRVAWRRAEEHRELRGTPQRRTTEAPPVPR